MAPNPMLIAALKPTLAMPFRSYYASELTRLTAPAEEGGTMAWNLIVSAALVLGGGIFAGSETRIQRTKV